MFLREPFGFSSPAQLDVYAVLLADDDVSPHFVTASKYLCVCVCACVCV